MLNIRPPAPGLTIQVVSLARSWPKQHNTLNTVTYSPSPTWPHWLVTPPPKRPTKSMLVQGSPNNPFLVNPADSPASVPSSPVGLHKPTPDKEIIHHVLYAVLPLLHWCSHSDLTHSHQGVHPSNCFSSAYWSQNSRNPKTW